MTKIEDIKTTPEIAKEQRKELIQKNIDSQFVEPLKDIEKKIENRREAEELEELKNSCLDIKYDKNGNIKKVNVSIPNLVNHLIKKYNFRTIFGSKIEDIWIYWDGIYVKKGKELIQTETEKILGEYCTNYYIKEIVEKIKRLTAISIEEFDNIPEDLICVENGIIDLKTQEFLGYDPKYYFKNKIPVIYDKEADCPKIKKFLEETLYPEDLKVVQEWFGFCLYKRYFIKKAMIIFGDPDTSKTLFLNLLMTFLGKKNISGISLQRIAMSDKFALASLKDKFANVFDDLSSKDLVAGGFKVATGGGYITAEYKFGDPFQFLTFAKHIFATNKIPPIKDIDSDDMAYYDRWLPIPYDNKIEKQYQDPFLLDKLTTKEELSGLLNYALGGLKRLLKNGIFSFDKNPEDIKKIMERQGNPLVAFCQDILVQNDGNRISKELMFEFYSAYVNKKGFARLSKEQLGRRLGKIIPYVIAKHTSNVRFWENVDINPNVDKDIYDTLYSIIRVRKLNSSYNIVNKGDIDYIYIFFSDVSLVSEEVEKSNDINDTILENEVSKISKEPKEEDKPIEEVVKDKSED